MSSTGPTRDDSLIPSEILRRISLRPSRFLRLQNTKSSSLMRQITQGTTYNSSYGHLLRSLLATADSSSPVTTKTKSLNPSTVDVPSSTLPSKGKRKQHLQDSSSSDCKTSLLQRVLDLIKRSLQNSSKSTSQTGDESSMSVNDIQWGDKLTLEFLHLSRTFL